MPSDLTERLKDEARRLGFDLVGVAPAVLAPGYGRFVEWLEHGRDAGMAYLRHHAEARRHPGSILEGVRSVLVVGMIYGRHDPSPLGPTRGRVARYARGTDYHEVLWRKLDDLLAWLKNERPEVVGRGICDTAPLLERDYARLAGLGWIGKNTCLIDRKAGSFTVLGSLLVDIELDFDSPHETNHCGTCTRCLEACPTDAFDGPYQLDARKCISYWTIEHKGMIPDLAAESLGDWAFGCDICQEVCPWNRKAPPGREAAFEPGIEWTNPDLITWLKSDPVGFRKSLKGTALARSKRSGLLRNAALIVGTRRSFEAVPALIECLNDEDPVIRGSSAWALGRIGTEEARNALKSVIDEAEPIVLRAIQEAMARIDERSPHPRDLPHRVSRAEGVDAGQGLE